ncbi:MAG: PAS domain S-box protein, partial [Acidimicrobiales bacterium]
RRAAERHAALVDASPDAIINLDADLKIIGWNAAAITLFGPKEQAGVDRSFDSVFESTSKRAELMQALEALKQTSAWRGETEFLDVNGEKLPVEINASVVKNEFGVFAGVVMVVRDIRERRQSEEMIRMLNSEIIHRSNNQFAVIQAIARSTARYSEPQEFIDVFTQRLYALGRSLKLLNERTNNATDLRDLVALQTSHLGPDHTSRIQISGAPLNIAGKTAEAVGLAIFELSTNAVKYGALSEKFTKSGRVLINWESQDGQVLIRWTESGVEGVSAPTRNGFGSRLTGQLLERTIRGKVHADYNPNGLAWSLTLPEKHLIGI